MPLRRRCCKGLPYGKRPRSRPAHPLSLAEEKPLLSRKTSPVGRAESCSWGEAQRKGGGRRKTAKRQVSLVHIVQFLSELPVPKKGAYFPKLKTTPPLGVQMRKEPTSFSLIETHTPPH